MDNSSLKLELWNSTWGWKTINSPLLPAEPGAVYSIAIDIKGQNAHQVHTKMVEFDVDETILSSTYNAFVNDGTFSWTHITFNFEPTNKTTKYLQLQIWHGHETNKPLPNTIWLDNVRVNGYATTINTTGLDLIFSNSTENQPATILYFAKVNPTKIVASVNATRPFVLVVSESFDQLWKAYVNGEQVESEPTYLGLKGFYINQTGLLEIAIEYEPQKWFYLASAISIATLVICTACLTFTHARTKTIAQKIKQKLIKPKEPREKNQNQTQTN